MAQPEDERLLSEIDALFERKEEIGDAAYTAELERLAKALSEHYRRSLSLQPGEGYAALNEAKALLKTLSQPPILE